MLKSVGVKNLRSFSKYAHSELKPLTVFLGRNSSGKSSLIRLFPLLRQSVEETTTGPILWYGRYVDYGNFNEAVCKKDKDENNIKLYFDIELDTTPVRLRNHPNLATRFPLLNFNVEIEITESQQKTYTKSIQFSIDDATVSVTPDFENNRTIVQASSKRWNYKETADGSSKKDYKFFPTINWLSEGDKKSNSKKVEAVNSRLQIEYLNYISRNRFKEMESEQNLKICKFAAKQIKKFFHTNTKLDNISNELLGIRAFSRDRLEHGIKSLFQSHAFFQKTILDPQKKSEFLDTLYPLILLKNYNSIADMINESLIKSFLSVKYLAPIRANTERFYRFQDLQVEEMDHTGSNIAMILNSFNAKETLDFQKWTEENFGFIAFVTTDGSHYAIKIKTDNDNEEHNISDMGYGYSQVLPIIMTIWLEIHSNEDIDDEIMFVIEQPELHLHPEYQSKVAHLFAKIINTTKESKRNIKFIFETHSQSMIDAIGDCIQERKIAKDDVNIMIFEKNKDEGSTTYTAHFDDNGYFTNWPVGFFSGN